jgi:hypothetical protein
VRCGEHVHDATERNMAIEAAQHVGELPPGESARRAENVFAVLEGIPVWLTVDAFC